MFPNLFRPLDPRLFAGIWVALMGCAAAPSTPEVSDDLQVAAEEERDAVLTAMNQELERSMQHLQFDEYESPYYMMYHVRDEETFNVSGRYGAVTDESHDRRRYAYVESRVGDYQFDNFANIDADTWRQSDFRPDQIQPLDSDVDALRGALWLLTDQAYKQALSDYQTKRGGAVYEVDDELEIPSFSREEPRQFRGDPRPLELDVPHWRQQVRDITARMREYEFLMDAKMDVRAQRQVRFLVNSEGTEIVDERTLYSVHAQAFTRAEDGMLLENSRRYFAMDADRLPDEETIRTDVDEMIDDLEALREAPVLDPYTGPAILAPEAAGVLFHEAVGHRLEGERQLDDSEGRTFSGQVDTQVMPEFLSVYDDPLMEEYDGTQLNGYYRFDDEGVRARRATLVEDGVLEGFLMSRTPIEDFEGSNGHGRSETVQVPRARMANFVIEADREAQYTEEELREQLIEEARRQGKPYGLLIRDVTGGSTNTLGFGYQAFKGIPRMIYRVDVETGEETLVRGVEMVGTPLSAINEIEAAGEQMDVFNGFCGAESGRVPVSTVAPALLTGEIELQRARQLSERSPVLPAPWNDPSDAEPADSEGE